MNSDINDLQNLLLRWISYKRECKKTDIIKAYEQILNSYNYKNSHSINISSDLMKKGLIEFIGNGKYSVSNSVILFYMESSKAVCINLSDEDKINIRKSFEISEDKDLVLRINTDWASISDFSQNNQIYLYEPKVESLLHQIPSISDVISQFSRIPTIIERKEFYNYRDYSWTLKEQNTGLFRLQNGKRFFLRINNADFEIPSEDENPDYRYIIKSYLQLQERDCYASYSESKQELTLRWLSLPLLLERIIRIASYYRKDGIVNSNNETKFKCITLPAMKEIQRILGLRGIKYE